MVIIKVDDIGNQFDPHKYRSVKNPMNNGEVFINLIKCAFGTGCLAMPRAFYNAGWLNGLISTLVIGSIIIYCMHKLLHGMYDVCKRHQVPYLSYTDAMEVAFKDGPPILRPFSTMIAYVVDFFLAFYHFGVCCVYVVFIAKNLKQIVDLYWIELDIRVFMLILAIPLMLTYLIRDLKFIVPFAAIADILLIIGYIFLLSYMLNELPDLKERRPFQKWEQYPLFFGTVLFSIESIGVIISLESQMMHPKKFLGSFGLLNRGMIFVLVFYSIFGLIGYWRYGDDVEGTVTMNIPEADNIQQAITFLFALAIFLSYSLQGYVTIDILWNSYIEHALIESDRRPMEYVVRISIVLATVLCAIDYPDFSLFLSFVGAFCLSQLGIIFPSLMDLCVKYHTGYGLMKIYLLKNLILIAIGVVVGFLGTKAALGGIAETYKKL